MFVYTHVQQRLVHSGAADVQARKREQEVAKSIFLFVGIFALYWPPSVVTETIKQSDSTVNISEHVCRAVLFLGLLNSALNPNSVHIQDAKFSTAVVRIFSFRSLEIVAAV